MYHTSLKQLKPTAKSRDRPLNLYRVILKKPLKKTNSLLTVQKIGPAPDQFGSNPFRLESDELAQKSNDISSTV